MGFFSLFRKPRPEDVYRSVAQKIVAASLHYRLNLPAAERTKKGHKPSADAGAEMAYLLLHFVDKTAFDILGVSRRDTVFDQIATIVIADYARAVLKPETPEEVISHVAEQMLEILNERQMIYAQCDSLVDEEMSFPSRGTMVFAFSFFVHRALGHTRRTDVDDILTGKRNVSRSELDDFPDPEVLIQAAASVVSTLTTLGLPQDLKYLK